jgi:DNA-binding transcriptional ArsR family regulator
MTPRPSGRSAAASPTREGARPKPAVRDFTGGAVDQAIEWDVRTVYDFLFSLSDDAGTTDDLPAEDRRWLTENRAELARDQPVLELSNHDVAVHVAGFAVERPWLKTIDAFLDALDAEGPAPLLQAIFSETVAAHPSARGPLERALRGDAGARAELERLLPELKRKKRMTLLDDPTATHRRIVGVLRAWAERFATIEPRIQSILERDYALRAIDRARSEPTEVVERATGGIRLLPEPGVRRIILAPSYFSRPFNFLLAGEDWRFFGYPVADDALDVQDPLAPPLSVLRLHRALGDGTRLRILKLLSAGDLYLTEIAQQLALSKPTIKHHMVQLRAAGLVTIIEAGSVMYYSLRRDRLDDASIDLKGFLIG